MASRDITQLSKLYIESVGTSSTQTIDSILEDILSQQHAAPDEDDVWQTAYDEGFLDGKKELAEQILNMLKTDEDYCRAVARRRSLHGSNDEAGIGDMLDVV